MQESAMESESKFLVKLSLSQMLKSRGFWVKTIINSNHVHVDLGNGEKSVTFDTGLALQALRYCERLFEDTTGYPVSQCTGSEAGIGSKWVRNTFGGRDLLEAMELMNKYEHDINVPKQDEDGFFKSEKERKIVAFSEYVDAVDGCDCDGVVCKSPIAMSLFKSYIRENGVAGVWEGNTFIFEKESATEVDQSLEGVKREILEIYYAWIGAEEVELSTVGLALATELEQSADDTAVDGAVGESLKLQLKKLLQEPLTSSTEERRNEVYYAGGRAPSGRSAKSLATCIFPEEKMKVDAFIEETIWRLKTAWDYESKAKTYGFKDVGLFAIGQMVRARGQLVFNWLKDEVYFEPKPEQYLAAQKRLSERLSK